MLVSELKTVDYLFSFHFSLLFYFLFYFLFVNLELEISITLYVTVTTITNHDKRYHTLSHMGHSYSHIIT